MTKIRGLKKNLAEKEGSRFLKKLNEKGMIGVFEKEHQGWCSFKGEGIVTPCFPQFVINHKIGISMLMHEENVNVLLFELPITDCGG